VYWHVDEKGQKNGGGERKKRNEKKRNGKKNTCWAVAFAIGLDPARVDVEIVDEELNQL
jgi:hypothetical protein